MTQLTLWLGQGQFFGSLGFLLVCLALELGLAWVLLWFRLRTGHSVHTGWLDAYRFWARVFTLTQALGFGVGVLVLLQFAALWSGLAERAGDAMGPLIAWAVVSFFVMRTAALGFMLFGQQRLSARLHTMAVAGVAIGSTLTLFFILALLAWVQTPSGVHLFNTEFVVIDPWGVVFSPFLLPLSVFFIGISALLCAWLMLAVVGVWVARQQKMLAARAVYRTALVLAVTGLVLHLLSVSGVLVHDKHHLPARAAATAAYWNSASPPDLAIVAWPSVQDHTNRWLWNWPNAARLVLGQDEDGHWLGLDQYSGMTPPVALTFWSFRIMMISFLLLIAAVWSCVRHGRKRGFDPGRLPAATQNLLRWFAPVALLLAASGLAWMMLGMLPYAISSTVTFSEVLSDVSLAEVALGLVLHVLCLVALATGFGLVLRHTVRYGVVPVRRDRRLV